MLMVVGCRGGQYWDSLIKQCMSCHVECKGQYIRPRCSSYCESAACRKLPGHFYDVLLKMCVRCADICGRHPPECIQHCHTPPPLAPTQKLAVEVTKHVSYTRCTEGLRKDSSLLLYSLLGLCMVLLLFSLFLALVVFLRRTKCRTSNLRQEDPNHNQKHVVRQDQQEVGKPGSQEDILTHTNHLTEPLEDSSPTETCVCVHCFPELRASGQDNEKPLRTPFSFYPQVILHRAQTGGPLWTEGNQYTSGREVKDEAAEG